MKERFQVEIERSTLTGADELLALFQSDIASRWRMLRTKTLSFSPEKMAEDDKGRDDLEGVWSQLGRNKSIKL